MKILVVEDDPHKSREVSSFMRQILPEAMIVEKQSYQSGLKQAVAETPDLILLDMTMPTFDVSPIEKGGRTRAYAGRDILREICRRQLVPKVIVVTQFESFGTGQEKKTLEELKSELSREFPGNYVATVYYHPSATNWKRDLEKFVLGLSSK